jgi:hypothetical protein
MSRRGDHRHQETVPASSQPNAYGQTFWHPQAGSKRAKLFVLVDDHSRLLLHGRWMAEENTRAGQDVLRAAIVRRGLPEVLYVDNGAPYANAALERCCAVLGIRLVHSQPYRPQGRGKQERLNRVIRERFLPEAEAAQIASLDELNDRFAAWTEQVLNCRVHAETGQTPTARFLAGGPGRAARGRSPSAPEIPGCPRWAPSATPTTTPSSSPSGPGCRPNCWIAGDGGPAWSSPTRSLSTWRSSTTGNDATAPWVHPRRVREAPRNRRRLTRTHQGHPAGPRSGPTTGVQSL